LPVRKKGKRESEDPLVTLKIRASTKKELTKVKNLMGFYMERDVTYDEVVQEMLKHLPKVMVGLFPEEVQEAEKK